MRSLAALLAFATSAAFAQGSATLSWTPPTQHTDGTPLTDLTTYRAYWGTSPSGFMSMVTIPAPATSAVISQLGPGAWYFAVTALDSTNNESALSNVATKTIAAAPIFPPNSAAGFSLTFTPSPPVTWQSQDIGTTGGSFAIAGSTVTLKGAGADVWGTSDQFRYAYQPLIGDGEIVARIDSLAGSDPWAKAGVMIRDTLTPSSAYAFMLVTIGNGIDYQRRLAASQSAGVSGASDGTTRAPIWVRLVRVGGTITGYTSANGSTWTTRAAYTIPLGAAPFIGLAVTGHSTTLATAVFSNVTVTP